MYKDYIKTYDRVFMLQNNNYLVSKRYFDNNNELCDKYFIIYEDKTIIEIGDINLVDMASKVYEDFYWDSNYIYKCLRNIESNDLSIDKVYDIKERCFLTEDRVKEEYTYFKRGLV